MADGKINEQILKCIGESSAGDKEIEKCLTELLFEEAERPGQWQWKGTYRKKVREHSEKWTGHNEN